MYQSSRDMDVAAAQKTPGDWLFAKLRYLELEARWKGKPRGCAPAFPRTILLQSLLLAFCSDLAFFSCFITVPGCEHAGLLGRRVHMWDFDMSTSEQEPWKPLGQLEHQEVQLMPTSLFCWWEASVAKPSWGF